MNRNPKAKDPPACLAPTHGSKLADRPDPARQRREISRWDLLRFTLIAAVALVLFVWAFVDPPLSAEEREVVGRWYVARPGVARILEFGPDRELRTLSHPYVRITAGAVDAPERADPAPDAGRLPIEAVGRWRSERDLLFTRSWFPQNARSFGQKLRDFFVRHRWSAVAVTETTLRWRRIDADEIELEVMPSGGRIRAVRVTDDFAFPDVLRSVDEVKLEARAALPAGSTTR